MNSATCKYSTLSIWVVKIELHCLMSNKKTLSSHNQNSPNSKGKTVSIFNCENRAVSHELTRRIVAGNFR